MINFRLSPEILNDLISQNKEVILENISSTPLEQEKIKILKSKYLEPLYDSIDNRSDIFILLIPKDSLNSISYDLSFESFKNNLLSELRKGYNKFTISNTLKITNCESTSYESTHEAINDYNSLSQNSVLFYFGEKLDTFINGHTEHLNTFYCDADIQRYKQKYTIEELVHVLDKYAHTYLVRQDEYSRFFENKANIDKLSNKNSYYVLRNKPEKFMRDQLRYFLNENMQARFQIEIELPVSKRKLDLYTEVNGKFYFIEIKWLGTCINDKCTALSTSYSDARAREGVIQTLQYIEELKVSTTNNVQCGHLVIFDARLSKTPIDYKNFNFIEENLKPYRDYLNIYDTLNLNNTHPC